MLHTRSSWPSFSRVAVACSTEIPDLRPSSEPLSRKNALGRVPCRLSGGQRAMSSMCYFKVAAGRRAEGPRMEAISVTQGEMSGDTAFFRARISPNPASVEAQTPDVGPERGSAVMGGGRR